VNDSTAGIWPLDKRRMKRHILDLCSIDRKSFRDDAWVHKNFERVLPDKFRLSRIALCERKPVGYLIASRYGNRCAHVHRFVVISLFRRRGIGTGLMRSFENACREKGLDEITLESLEKRHDANRFYELTGFARLSEERLLSYLRLRGKTTVKQRYSGLYPSGEVVVYNKRLIP
jgi:GNAT superfamily N-acetyltransferase